MRFLETMPAAFCFLDRDWRFRYVNAEAERLLGRTPGRARSGRSLWEAFPASSGSVVRGELPAAVRHRAADGFETPTTPAPPDGWFEVRAWPSPDGLSVYFLDVTERRDAEEHRPPRRAPAALLAAGERRAGRRRWTPSRRSARLARLVVPGADRRLHRHRRRPRGPRPRRRLAGTPTRRGARCWSATPRCGWTPCRRLPGGPGAARRRRRSPSRWTPSCDLLPPGPARDLLTALAPTTAVVLPLTRGGPHARRPHALPRRRPHRSATEDLDDRPPGRRPRPGRRWTTPGVHRQSQQAQLAEALQRSLLTEPPETRPRARSRCATCPRPRPPASAATGTTPSCSATGARRSSSATSSGTTPRRPRRWASCAACCAASPTYSGAGPAEVLRGLDEAIADMHTDTLATAAVARFEQTATAGRGRRRLRWANAGHPPPLAGHPGRQRRRARRPGSATCCSAWTRSARASESVVDARPGTTRAALHRRPGRAARTADLDDGHRPAARRCSASSPACRWSELCDELLDAAAARHARGRRRAGRRPAEPRGRRGRGQRTSLIRTRLPAGSRTAQSRTP